MQVDSNLPLFVARELLPSFGVTAIQAVAGGLSHARVWKCASRELGTLCLRRWGSAHPTEARLQLIHAAQHHASQLLPFVPKVHRDHQGRSYWMVEGLLWELTQWMPGTADYLKLPSRSRLGNAMESLAQLHQVWYELTREHGSSRAVAQRVETLSRWLSMRDLVEKVGSCVRDNSEASMCMSTIQMLQVQGPGLYSELQKAADEVVVLHPVLRDFWSEHLLFDGAKVSGIIDYGALRIDEPATDLARLLGSLHPFESEVRREAVEQYNAAAVCPVDFSRVDLLDRSGTLLAALQWLDWLVLERRKFNVPASSLFARWQLLLSRMMGEGLIVG